MEPERDPAREPLPDPAQRTAGEPDYGVREPDRPVGSAEHETAQEVADPTDYSDLRRCAAEAIGTFVLVFSAVGTAVFAGDYVGQLGVALAFGLTLLFLVYTIGPISGCHVNPAVTLGHLIVGQVTAVRAVGYWIAQMIGGLVAGVTIYAIASSLPSYNRAADGLGANGWGAHSPSAIRGPLGGVLENGYGIGAAMIVEILLTALLVFVVLSQHRPDRRRADRRNRHRLHARGDPPDLDPDRQHVGESRPQPCRRVLSERRAGATLVVHRLPADRRCARRTRLRVPVRPTAGTASLLDAERRPAGSGPAGRRLVPVSPVVGGYCQL